MDLGSGFIGLMVFKIRGVGYRVKGCQKKEELGYLLAWWRHARASVAGGLRRRDTGQVQWRGDSFWLGGASEGIWWWCSARVVVVARCRRAVTTHGEAVWVSRGVTNLAACG